MTTISKITKKNGGFSLPTDKQYTATLIFIFITIGVFSLLMVYGAEPIKSFVSAMSYGLIILSILGFGIGIKLIKILTWN